VHLFVSTLPGREALLKRSRPAIDLDPHFGMAHWALGGAHPTDRIMRTRWQTCAPLWRSLMARPAWSHRSRLATAEAGRPDEARRLLEELRVRAQREYVPGLSLAAVCAALGETEEAFAWLDTAYEERDVGLPFLRDRLATGGSLWNADRAAR